MGVCCARLRQGRTTGHGRPDPSRSRAARPAARGRCAGTAGAGAGVATSSATAAAGAVGDRHEPELGVYCFSCFVWGASVATLVPRPVQPTGERLFGDTASQLVSAPVIEDATGGCFASGDAAIQRTPERADSMQSFARYLSDSQLGAGHLPIGPRPRGLVGGAPAVALIRGVMTPFLHPAFTVLTGLGDCLRGLRSRVAGRFGWPLLGYLGAVLVNALWNTGLGVTLLVLCVPVFISGGAAPVLAASPSGTGTGQCGTRHGDQARSVAR